MRKIVVIENMSLDGVMQAPGRTDNPFTEVLDNSQKYVVSRTLPGPLPWKNSTPLGGDAAETVANLKAEPGRNLLVMGSGALVPAHMRRSSSFAPSRRAQVSSLRSSGRPKQSREDLMKHYLLNIYQPDGDPPPPEVLDKIMRDVEAVNREMKAAGAWVFAGGLHPASTSTVVRVRAEESLVTDGPYVEGKEHIGGFTVVKAPDLDAALDWGRKLSRATTLPIEVRPFRG